MKNLEDISKILSKLKSSKEVGEFLNEIFTQSELKTLSKRWQILKMLKKSCTQRDIATKLNVSLCKVTRGAKILKNDNAIVKKFL